VVEIQNLTADGVRIARATSWITKAMRRRPRPRHRLLGLLGLMAAAGDHPAVGAHQLSESTPDADGDCGAVHYPAAASRACSI